MLQLQRLQQLGAKLPLSSQPCLRLQIKCRGFSSLQRFQIKWNRHKNLPLGLSTIRPSSRSHRVCKDFAVRFVPNRAAFDTQLLGPSSTSIWRKCASSASLQGSGLGLFGSFTTYVWQPVCIRVQGKCVGSNVPLVSCAAFSLPSCSRAASACSHVGPPLMRCGVDQQ